jgi:hypothetical protein
MDASRILDELAESTLVPRAAILAAEADRQSVLPVFLQAIEDQLAVGAAIPTGRSPILLIFHLLGEWREKLAYRQLLRLLRLPPGHLDRLLGDALTETAHRVIAAVFDGDPEPLYDLILDIQADEYARSRMCEVVAMLAVNGDLPRAEAARFLRACFTSLKPREDCAVWDGWQTAVAMLGLEDMRPMVKEAFDKGAIHPQVTSFAYFEEDIGYALAHPEAPHPRWDAKYAVWSDTIGELSGWYGFSERYDADRRRWAGQASSEERFAYAALDRFEPIVNPNRNVGRNDPCPCGSGKKYKKCCLN